MWNLFSTSCFCFIVSSLVGNLIICISDVRGIYLTEQPNYVRCKDISLFCALTENVEVIASIVAGAVGR